MSGDDRKWMNMTGINRDDGKWTVMRESEWCCQEMDGNDRI